jgi:hypothetical protein
MFVIPAGVKRRVGTQEPGSQPRLWVPDIPLIAKIWDGKLQ